MCKDTQVAEKKTHHQQQQHCWRQPGFAESCKPNYINIEIFIKMNDSSFAWEMSADNGVSSSKCNFLVLLEWYQSHCWQPSWISKLTQLSSLVSRSGRHAVHAFIPTTLDYCNSRCTCLNQLPVYKLQLVLKIAGRLFIKTPEKKKDCINLVLAFFPHSFW